MVAITFDIVFAPVGDLAQGDGFEIGGGKPIASGDDIEFPVFIDVGDGAALVVVELEFLHPEFYR